MYQFFDGMVELRLKIVKIGRPAFKSHSNIIYGNGPVHEKFAISCVVE